MDNAPVPNPKSALTLAASVLPSMALVSAVVLPLKWSVVLAGDITVVVEVPVAAWLASAYKFVATKLTPS